MIRKRENFFSGGYDPEFCASDDGEKIWVMITNVMIYWLLEQIRTERSYLCPCASLCSLTYVRIVSSSSSSCNDDRGTAEECTLLSAWLRVISSNFCANGDGEIARLPLLSMTDDGCKDS